MAAPARFVRPNDAVQQIVAELPTSRKLPAYGRRNTKCTDVGTGNFGIVPQPQGISTHAYMAV
jgi:hypothetical protein